MPHRPGVFPPSVLWQDRKEDGSDRMLDPDAIAEAYLQFHNQQRSAWAWEVELRPWVEKF